LELPDFENISLWLEYLLERLLALWDLLIVRAHLNASEPLSRTPGWYYSKVSIPPKMILSK